MPLLPEPLQRLILALERLPGIGPKTASRLAFFLLKAPQQVSSELAEALNNLRMASGECQTCFNITLVDQTRCDICADAQRDETIICVVEDPMDVLAIERAAAFQGKYHVLHGALSPIEGIGPDDLRIHELEERVKNGVIKEIIIATCASRAWRGDYR